jgi:tRNA-specific 2-thiouridylase
MAGVALLMSGGVDSSGAALLLKQRGLQVTGLTARMWGSHSDSAGEEAIQRAGDVCAILGMRHIVVDVASDFQRCVVEPFAKSYLNGKTPNPCAWCNREIKLGKMAAWALGSGFDSLATGHYAALGWVGGRCVLCEPLDRRKSQVYFLSLTRPQILSRLEFPLQLHRKDAVRKMVESRGLPVRSEDSQDLCFVTSGRYHELLERRAGAPGPGQILDIEGQVVGTHRGHYAYTVGQRLGLRGRRYYVVEKRPDKNQIVIAERGRAVKHRIMVANLNWFLPPEAIEGQHLLVKFRYNSAPVRARAIATGTERATFLAEEPCFAPAPGQILAGCRDDCLVCGGIIESAS